jgi:hypothetical protein
VAHQVVEQDDRPDKKVYAVTEAGRAALRAWVASELDEAPVRDELVLRAYSVWLADPGAAAALFREWAPPPGGSPRWTPRSSPPTPRSGGALAASGRRPPGAAGSPTGWKRAPARGVGRRTGPRPRAGPPAPSSLEDGTPGLAAEPRGGDPDNQAETSPRPGAASRPRSRRTPPGRHLYPEQQGLHRHEVVQALPDEQPS